MQDLELWFNKAKLPIKVEKEPLRSRNMAVNNQDIFQMSIDTRGKKNRQEYFRVFHGNKNNDVRVIDTDSGNQQVILLVSEPEREYSTRQWSREKNDWIFVKQKAPGYLRKYLCGFDEKHLFIAELPNNLGAVNKVKDAHRILKPEHVAKKERVTGRIKRQGEWFFIPVTHKEQKFIEANMNLIEKKDRIGGGWRGNAHIADILLRIRGMEFVTGKISHIEHKTLRLHGWFSVARNAEARITGTQSAYITNGVKWVD